MVNHTLLSIHFPLSLYLKPDCSPCVWRCSFSPLLASLFQKWWLSFGGGGGGTRGLLNARHPPLHLAGTWPSRATTVATRVHGSTVHLTSSSAPVGQHIHSPYNQMGQPGTSLFGSVTCWLPSHLTQYVCVSWLFDGESFLPSRVLTLISASHQLVKEPSIHRKKSAETEEGNNDLLERESPHCASVNAGSLFTVRLRSSGPVRFRQSDRHSFFCSS